MKGTPRALWALLLLFAIVASMSSIAVPPFETPDEIWHYAVIQQLATGGGLPVSEPQTEAMWRQQGAQAPGYYLVAAALTAWIPQQDFVALYQRTNPHVAMGQPDLPNRNFFLHYPGDGWPWQGPLLALHVTRLLSVLLGCVTLWAIYQTLRYLVNAQQALLATALFGFIPQYVFLSGAATNDNAINATTALLLWRLTALLEAPPAPTARRPFVLVGLLLGAALLSKISGLWLVLVVAGVIAYLGWRRYGPRWTLTSAITSIGVALLVAGWWFVRSAQLYGDPLAAEIWRSNIGLRPQPASLFTIASEWEGFHHSFWGLFGWFNVPYPLWLYRTLEALTLVIGVGLLLRLWHWFRQGRPIRPSAVMLLVWLLMLTLSWLGAMRLVMAAQGRYLHPAGPTLALLLFWGLTAWTDKGRPWLAATVAVSFFLLSVVTPWWIIKPAYQPSATLASVPPTATPTDVQYGDQVQLLGYELATAAVAPDGQLPITLYWQALRPMQDNYSLSVKLVAHNEDILAASDSMADGGRWPTALWPVGAIIPDRRVLVPSSTVDPPEAGALAVDVYRYGPLTVDLPRRLYGTETEAHVPGTLVAVREPATAAPVDYSYRIASPHLRLDGDQVTISFRWEVGQPLTATYQAFLHLTTDPAVPPVAQDDFEPTGSRMPTQLWLPGDQFDETATLALPRQAVPGRYLLVTGLYDLVSGQRLTGEGERDAWLLGTLSWDGRKWAIEP